MISLGKFVCAPSDVTMTGDSFLLLCRILSARNRTAHTHAENALLWRAMDLSQPLPQNRLLHARQNNALYELGGEESGRLLALLLLFLSVVENRKRLPRLK